jgi:hypothetical protein
MDAYSTARAAGFKSLHGSTRFPAARNNFPVNSRRELLEKWRPDSDLAINASLEMSENIGISLQTSLFAGNFAGDWCDRHCIASQPVRLSRHVSKEREKGPQTTGFCDLAAGLQLPISLF